MVSNAQGASSVARPVGGDAQRAARNISALMAASIISKGALFAWQLALSLWLGPGRIWRLRHGRRADGECGRICQLQHGSHSYPRCGATARQSRLLLDSHALLADSAGAAGLCGHERAVHRLQRDSASFRGAGRLEPLHRYFRQYGARPAALPRAHGDYLCGRNRAYIPAHRLGAAGADGRLGLAGRLPGGDCFWLAALPGADEPEHSRWHPARLPVGPRAHAQAAHQQRAPGAVRAADPGLSACGQADDNGHIG